MTPLREFCSYLCSLSFNGLSLGPNGSISDVAPDSHLVKTILGSILFIRKIYKLSWVHKQSHNYHKHITEKQPLHVV